MSSGEGYFCFGFEDLVVGFWVGLEGSVVGVLESEDVSFWSASLSRSLVEGEERDVVLEDEERV